MLLIDKRPESVADRQNAGHWEGDLIIGRNSGSAIGTLVERTSRLVKLVHLPSGHDSLSVRDALIATMGEIPAHLRLSLTWDQGSELARHREVEAATGTSIFFCNPGKPVAAWQQ